MGRVNPCRQKTGPRAFARGPICFLMELHGAGDLAGAEAAGAHIDVLGRAVHHSLDALDVGLPGTVGTAVGVGHLNAEVHAFAAKLAFGHID